MARTYLIEKSGKYTLNQRIASLTPNQNIDNYFLYILLNRNRYFLSFDDGAKQTNLSISDVLNFEFNAPSKNEQIKIGRLFKNLDTLITLHQRKLIYFNCFKPKMFLSDIEFKNTFSWEQCKYGQIFDYERPDKYIVKSDKYVDDAPTPVLTANKTFILGYTKETNTYKKPCIIFDDFTLDNKLVNFDFMVKSSALKILTVKSGYDLIFSYSRLQSTKIEVLGHARHYISVVQNTSVYCPNFNEQKLIGTLFNKLDNLITLHQRE